MNESENGFKRILSPEDASKQLDQSIREAAAQLVGHNPAYESPLVRFVLLCTARAQLEDEGVVGTDPELQWVQIAKDAFVTAAADQEGHLPLPVLLSDSRPGRDSQRELYQKMVGNLIIANTDESPEDHNGINFAIHVADGTIHIRYTEDVTRIAAFPEEL